MQQGTDGIPSADGMFIKPVVMSLKQYTFKLLEYRCRFYGNLLGLLT